MTEADVSINDPYWKQYTSVLVLGIIFMLGSVFFADVIYEYKTAIK
jgi:hypothetical protein